MPNFVPLPNSPGVGGLSSGIVPVTVVEQARKNPSMLMPALINFLGPVAASVLGQFAKDSLADKVDVGNGLEVSPELAYQGQNLDKDITARRDLQTQDQNFRTQLAEKERAFNSDQANFGALNKSGLDRLDNLNRALLTTTDPAERQAIQQQIATHSSALNQFLAARAGGNNINEWTNPISGKPNMVSPIQYYQDVLGAVPASESDIERKIQERIAMSGGKLPRDVAEEMVFAEMAQAEQTTKEAELDTKYPNRTDARATAQKSEKMSGPTGGWDEGAKQLVSEQNPMSILGRVAGSSGPIVLDELLQSFGASPSNPILGGAEALYNLINGSQDEGPEQLLGNTAGSIASRIPPEVLAEILKYIGR